MSNTINQIQKHISNPYDLLSYYAMLIYIDPNDTLETFRFEYPHSLVQDLIHNNFMVLAFDANGPTNS